MGPALDSGGMPPRHGTRWRSAIWRRTAWWALASLVPSGLCGMRRPATFLHSRRAPPAFRPRFPVALTPAAGMAVEGMCTQQFPIPLRAIWLGRSLQESASASGSPVNPWCPTCLHDVGHDGRRVLQGHCAAAVTLSASAGVGATENAEEPPPSWPQVLFKAPITELKQVEHVVNERKAGEAAGGAPAVRAPARRLPRTTAAYTCCRTLCQVPPSRAAADAPSLMEGGQLVPSRMVIDVIFCRIMAQ